MEETCDSCEMISYDETSEFGEVEKEYGDHVGIAVYGEKDQNGTFERRILCSIF